MTFPNKENLCHVGMPWALANELENQVFSPNATSTFGGSNPITANGVFYEEGNIYRATGNPFSANAADTTDDILGGIVIPAGAFDVSSRGLIISAQGKFGATANNKRFRIWVNPTMSGQTVTNGIISGGTVTGAGSGVLLLDSGTQTGNAVGWGAYTNYAKIGAAGSNTQYSQSQFITGTTHGGITVPLFPTQTESAVMNFVITGASQTTGAAADVILNFFVVTGTN